MDIKWKEAGGEYQMAFLGSASRIIDGKSDTLCPKCKMEPLRFYFHKLREEHGTIWVWCHLCHVKVHVPRVMPKTLSSDPFENLDDHSFVQLEMDEDYDFITRLNDLWEQGKLP